MKREKEWAAWSIALALSAGALLARPAAAWADGTPLPLTLYLEPGSDVATDEVARAVSAELGRPVRIADGTPESRGDALTVRSQNGVITERYSDPRGRHIERELTAPQDGSARVRTIALLAGNLARSEADEILGAQAAEPTAGPTEIVVRVAPGDKVRTTVETNVTATSAPEPTPIRVEAEPATHDVGSTQRTWGWITFATGASLAAAGGIYAAVSASQPDACSVPVSSGSPSGPATCSDNAHGHVILVDVAVGAGAVLAATGLVLVLSAPKERTSPSLAISAGPGTLRLGGSF